MDLESCTTGKGVIAPNSKPHSPTDGADTGNSSKNDYALEQLEKQIPTSHHSDLPESETSDDGESLVQELNREAATSLISIVKKAEDERLSRIKPLQYWLICFLGLQLIAFNAIVGFLVFTLFKNFTLDALSLFIEFLKYYVGAVLVELIGIMVFITKSTFTSVTKDIINGFLKKTEK